MARFKRTAHRVSLTAMFAAMSLLFLYLASIMPTMRIAMYFLSSVFVMGLVLEEEIGLAFMMFFVVSALSLLLVQGLIYTVPYVLFFGHYGIGKYFIQTNVKDKVVGYILKLLYYNISLALMYFLAREIIMQDVLGSGIAFWIIIILAQLAFVIYDYVFTQVATFYFNRIRRLLMKS